MGEVDLLLFFFSSMCFGNEESVVLVCCFEAAVGFVTSGTVLELALVLDTSVGTSWPRGNVRSV